MKLIPKLPLFLFLLLAFTSCKERNEDFPLVPWDTYFYSKADIAPRPVSAILVLNDHSEWYGSRDKQGLVHFNGYKWLVFDQSNTAVPFDSITAMLEDGNGLLWVSYKSGLASFDGKSWLNIPELSGLNITSLALQGIGIVWAGIDGNSQTGGLARFSGGNWSFMNPLNSGIASSHTRAVLTDASQNIWAASSDKGISRFNGREWEYFDTETLPVLSDNFSSLAMDPQGNVWAGTASSQLVRFSSSVVVFNTGTGSAVSGLLATGDGKIWIGTAGAGIVSFDGLNWQSYTKQNSRLPCDSVVSMGLHADGKIMAAFPDGRVIHFSK